MKDGLAFSCAYLARPGDAFAEQLRTLRARLLKFLKDKTKIVLVTSAWPGEGKSTVCLNLAACLGEFGLRVLLVDADLRSFGLSNLMGEAPGLTDLLQQTTLLPVQLPAKGVWLMPRGLTRAQPAQILQSPACKKWIRRQGDKFDVVLVDAPAISTFRDALWVAPQCDGALLVSSRRQFKGVPEGHLSEDLRDAGVEILGVVATP